jgi:hypothetical protein
VWSTIFNVARSAKVRADLLGGGVVKSRRRFWGIRLLELQRQLQHLRPDLLELLR